MSKGTVVLLFNTSDYMADPLVSLGFTVASFDMLNTTGATGAHYRFNMRVSYSQALAVDRIRATVAEYGLAPIVAVVSFAPCTDLTVAGARHWQSKRARDPLFQYKALSHATLAERFGVPYVVENPVGALSTLWRKPDLWVNPCDFGGYLPEDDVHPEAPQLYPPRDAYRKKTGLWLGNGMLVPVERPVEPLSKDNPGWAKLGGKSARTKYLRSLTPRGLAMALSEILAVSVDKLRDNA